MLTFNPLVPVPLNLLGAALQAPQVGPSSLGTSGGTSDETLGILHQTSRLQDLLDGHYEGGVALSSIKERGDFGIGTYSNYDGGEMVLLGGVFYSLPSPETAPIVVTDLERKTPFTMMTRFQPQVASVIDEVVRYDDLKGLLDRHLDPERHYALLLEGVFNLLDIQCVQTAPESSLPFSRVGQRRASFSDRRASLVGFRLAPGIEEVNKPGYHFHALVEGAGGGHILDLSGRALRLSVQPLNGLQIPAS